MKYFYNLFIVLFLGLSLLLSCTEKETTVEVSSVSLSTATIEMVEGETFNLVATVLPKDAEYDGVTWASSNISVASVQSGTVAALKEGTATITASAGGKSSTCSVKVSAKVIAVTSITLDKTSLSMQVGETETLTATVSPATATDKTVAWSSSDVSVAIVADGKITAKQSGTATITAKSGNCTAKCVVTVSVSTESVTLDKTTLSLAVGETAILTATVKPDDATDKKVTWTSSDESVAKVADGKVTAVKSGKATITAKCGGKTAECAVTVAVPVVSISLDKTTLSLAVGESAQLTATVSPADATDKNVNWSSSDESVASVSDGKVTAFKSGKATITAKCGGKSAECAVTVTVPTGSVTLDRTTLSLAVGESAQLTATVSPADATDKKVTWTSSDESVAKVADGKVTAVKSGRATITAECGGKSAECAVTVTAPVASISLDKATLSLAVGETATLTATVSPADATDKKVIWSSSDESVAKVADGKVTAVKSGRATITAECGGKSAECAVTVTVPVASISLDKATLSLTVGETATLTATVSPADATDKNVIWTSLDESVAKVNNGKVTAMKAGRATITAKCGDKFATCTVMVIVPVTAVTLDKTNISLIEGETVFITATVYPNTATDKTVVWKSSDESVVKVENGKVSAVKTGVAQIEVMAAGFSAYCDVTVISSDNVIYYTSRDGEVVNPFNNNAFGVKIVSNEYSDGRGRIVCDAPITEISASAFYKCNKLKTIQIPETVSAIGKDAFAGSNLTSINLPSLITTIEDRTFANCWLSDLELPKGIIKIGEEAFMNVWIKNINLPNGLKEIGKAAFISSSLTKVIIPGSVISIGDNSFCDCKDLTSVEIEEGTTSLLSYCFSGCESLLIVKLPRSITNIEYGAFSRCYVLGDIYLKAVIPPIIKRELFSNTSVNIWVPRSSVDAYKAAEGWSKYKDSIKGYDF